MRTLPKHMVSVLVAGMISGLTDCAAKEEYNARPDRIPTQGWAKPFPNPVLPAGSLRPQALWNDPTLLKENGQYVMYMTTSVKEPFKPPIVPFRAVSSDGVNWRLDPQTPVALPDGTRFVNVETPSVVKFQGRYHMFFSGVYPPGGPAIMAIGHAVSQDGVRWTVSRDPVISQTGKATDWNGVLVGEPGAIVRGNEIYVYFSAVGARPSGRPPQYQTIGLAKTQDGEHFGPAVKVLEQGAAYVAEKGYAGYSCPYPFELNGKIHLLYNVALNLESANPNWQQVALHHAVSPDGEHGFVQDDKPILTRNDAPWTMGEVTGPAGLVDGGKLKMWFGGHVPVSELGSLIKNDFKGPDFGIGYAERNITDLGQ